MTEAETWDALRKTALSDHDGWCNYGRTNGREMCTCEVLVNLLEGNDDETHEDDPVLDRGDSSRVGGASRSEQRARRLNQRQAASRRKR